MQCTIGILSISLAMAAGAQNNEPATNRAPQNPSVITKRLNASGTGQIVQKTRQETPEIAQLGKALRRLKAQTDSLHWLTVEQRESLNALNKRVGGITEIRVRPQTGTPSYLALPKTEDPMRKTLAPPIALSAAAYAFLNTNRALLRLEDPSQELKLTKQHIDELGQTHLRFAQTYRGLDVWPAELIVHMTKAGQVDCLNGAFVPTPAEVLRPPLISAEVALDLARQFTPDGSGAEPSAPVLSFYAPLDRPVRLAWKVELMLDAARHWLVVIDANNGMKLTAFNQVTDENVVGSGMDLLNQNRPLNTWHANNKYYLVDTSKPMFDATSMPPGNAKGAIMVVDANHQTLPASGSMSCVQITSTSPTSGWMKDGVSGSFGASQTYDYYRSWHGRNSIDGEGGGISAIVRYGQNYANAFWNGQALFFGDGKPFAAALDIVAHEMTHGVTSYSANLIYQDQSGAMNEAFSDIFGEAVEARTYGACDWAHGSDLGEASRSLSNPSSILFTPGYAYPSKMSQFIGPNDPVLSMFQNKDNGGVHINGTILSHAFYLLNTASPGPVPFTNSARIFYRALTTHLVAQSQFLDCRLACVKSAQELFGENSEEAKKTAQAFDAVELFDAVTSTNTPPNPTVTNSDSALLVYYDEAAADYYLARRENALLDPAYGTTLSHWPVYPRRPSVSGNGSYAAFVDSINDMCLIYTDGSLAEQSLGYPGQINSVAMAPDGQHYGFVFLGWDGLPDNKIRYFDLTGAGSSKTIDLAAPSDAGPVNSIACADTMCFTPDNRYLVYDALNTLQINDGTTQEAWSIYAYDLVTERILTIVAPMPNLDMSNPSVGHLANDLITFEVTDKRTGVSTILAANLRTGTNCSVGSVNGILAWPCYNGDDTAIAYTQVDDETPTGSSIMRQELGSNHLSPTGTATEWVDDGAYCFVYRRGTYTAPAAQKSSDLAVSLSVNPNPVPLNANVTFTVTVQNSGPDDATSVSIVNALPANTQFVSGTTSQGDGSHKDGKVTWAVGNLAQNGTATATIIAKATNEGIGVNSANAVGDQTDPNPANNVGTVNVTVGSGGNTATLSVIASPTSGGTVTGNGTYSVGSQQTITATANSGWVFTGWQDGNTQSARTVTVVAGGSSFTAYFVMNVSCQSVTVVSPEVPAAGTVGHVCNLSPNAALDRVTNRVTLPVWVTRAVLKDAHSTITMGPGVSVSVAAAPYTLAFDVAQNTTGNPRSAAVLSITYANCEQFLTLSQAANGVATATLAVQANPTAGGTVTGGGTFAVGSEHQINAIPNSGWAFSRWQDANTQNPRSVTIPAGGISYTAYFTNTPTVPIVQFSNRNEINIVDNRPATPYPATIVVTGLAGGVKTATVTIHNFNHAWPHDVGMLLVGPQGQKIVLCSNAGGEQPIGAVQLSFCDSSATSLGENTPITSGTFKPSACGAADTFAAPAPNPPYGTALSSLQGSDPNGTWSLYVHDDEPGDSGSVQEGWTLTLELQAAPLQITKQPTNQTVKIGGTAKLGVTAIGTGLLSYRWKKNQIELAESQRILGVSTSQLTITNVQSKDAGAYCVVVSNANETVTSQVANLQVETAQVVLLGSPHFLDNGLFQFTLSGTPGSNYEIRASSDLSNWKPLQRVLLLNQTTNIIDTNIGLPKRFYRAQSAP
jgi:uncharacterized repeat protein (TIGR01451 family)